MVQLHEIEEVRVYCGPAALIAITGERLPVVRSAINKAKGCKDNQGVIGLKNEHLEQAMELLGIWFEKTDTPYRITLENWIDGVMEKDTRYIVNITGHYVTVLNGLVIDNHTRFGTDISECKWAKKVVKRYYRIKG